MKMCHMLLSRADTLLHAQRCAESADVQSVSISNEWGEITVEYRYDNCGIVPDSRLDLDKALYALPTVEYSTRAAGIKSRLAMAMLEQELGRELCCVVAPHAGMLESRGVLEYSTLYGAPLRFAEVKPWDEHALLVYSKSRWIEDATDIVAVRFDRHIDLSVRPRGPEAA